MIREVLAGKAPERYPQPEMSSPWQPALLRERLLPRAGDELGDGKRAAVAIILRLDASGPSVLLMKRTERDGDPWSGHVSFPGGRHELDDVDLFATAVRETREELGLCLDTQAEFVGRLPSVPAMARGRALPMTISADVFVATTQLAPIASEEAASTFWLPIERTDEFDGVYLYPVVDAPAGTTIELPCWRYQGYLVWGLTYKMLQNFVLRITGRVIGKPMVTGRPMPSNRD